LSQGALLVLLSDEQELKNQPITGVEVPQDLGAPLGALQEFYYALNHRDLERMAENWERSDEAAMNNPLGGIKRGWPDIASVYRTIFSSPAEVHVEFVDYTLHETSDLFYAVGRERGWYQTASGRLDLAIRTTRIFRRAGQRWKQVHHHGSIDSRKCSPNTSGP
jgi:hypothetical protein